ncbi:MAG: Vacuolar protein sorting-associated protein 5 [Thelocarpon impressellum]|nr:MAG: Vacuolar protein sorting-associated protein 5 [Thelocarpon impressellum]
MSSDISPGLSSMDLEDHGESPWDDVPSRSQSSQNLPQAAEAEAFRAPDSPSKAKTSPAGLSPSSAAKAAPGRVARGPRRALTQPKRLEAVDDSLGPLGPLGDNPDGAPSSTSEHPPAPPRKELPAKASGRAVPTSPPATTINKSMMDSVDLEDEEERPSRARIPPPVEPSWTPQSPRETQRSVSIEQAAKPTFDISVGDPHKVGDLTSSHIVYQVRTKTTSKAYKQPEFAVSRRYRDFLWLYNQLHNNNPGVVVPPPPEKQAVGRFDTNFVESRRAALERMLNKSAAHPVLQHDGDLKLFLESDAFNVDVKHKERKEPGLGESKGMFSSFGLSVGSSGKFIEQDDWFHDRRIYLDALENQLKALLKAIDTVVKQRKELADAAGDFSASLHSLSTVELSTSLSGPLEALSDLQLRIRDLYDRQAQQDVLTLGITVDEYIRLIGSIKQSFAQRQKAFHSWQTADNEMIKRKATQDKLQRQGKTQQDRLNQLSADVADAERRVHQARLLFEDMGRLMKGELERFEREKVEDFKSGVETFLESAVEAQKELIELWETYLMQFDAEEDGPPFYKPPHVMPVTSETGGAGESTQAREDDGQTAATATAADEQEE